MIAGVRDLVGSDGLWFWFVGRHAVAARRLNCRLSAMVIHENLGVNLLLGVRYLRE